MNKRPHSDIIHAWAEGQEVQYRIDASARWLDTKNPLFREDIQYRIKPQKERVTQSRRFISNSGGRFFVDIINDPDTALAPEYYEKLPYFVKWVDEDWQIIEID